MPRSKSPGNGSDSSLQSTTDSDSSRSAARAVHGSGAVVARALKGEPCGQSTALGAAARFYAPRFRVRVRVISCARRCMGHACLGHVEGARRRQKMANEVIRGGNTEYHLFIIERPHLHACRSLGIRIGGACLALAGLSRRTTPLRFTWPRV